MAGETLSADDLRLDLLEKCPENKIDGLLHYVVDGLCRSCSPDYTKYSDVWNLEDWFCVLATIKKITIIFSKEELTKDEMNDSLGSLSEMLKGKIYNCISVRKSDLSAALVSQTLSISQAFLKDFDWKIKYALASDKISSVEEPIISLSFIIRDDDKNKTIPVEMNAKELKTLISSLEAANKAVLQLKS